MAVNLSATEQKYVMVQSFPVPDRPGVGNECLLRLQSDAPIVKARMYGADMSQALVDGEVLFQICPSPIGPVFRLECTPFVTPANHKMTSQELKLYTEERIIVEFAAYEQTDGVGNRTAVPYTSKDGNTPPSGPINFSPQLHHVSFQPGDQLSSEAMANPNKDQRKKEMCFRWKTQKCSEYAFDRPFPPDKQGIATKFKTMIRSAVKNDSFLIIVITKNTPTVATSFWTYFCSAPMPPLPSFWPWVGTVKLSDPDQWKEIMQFPPNKNFERNPEYLKRALAVRGKNWFLPGGDNATNLPKAADIAKLQEIVHFRDYRQYLAVVVGSFAYEEMRARSDVGSVYNGLHQCLIFAKAAPSEGSRRYLALLDIRPKRNEDTAVEAGLPKAGERVSLTLVYGGINQTWTGNVMDIPAGQRKHGFNVAVVVTSSPTIPTQGRIMSNSVTVEADMFFGHQGQNTRNAKERIMALMTGHTKSKGSDISADFFKKVLLAQNSWSSLSDTHNGNVNATGKRMPSHINTPKLLAARIEEVCKKMGLSHTQTGIVQHYFTHRITLVRGPPGTGKSTLINVIIALEEEFRQPHWICTDSNEACNVLVAKTIERRKSMQPDGSIRVRSAFEEKLEYSVDGKGSFSTTGLIQEKPTLEGDVHQAIQDFLAEGSNEEKVMSLGNLIKLRMNLFFTGKLDKPKWPKEFEDYRALVSAARAFGSLKFNNQSESAFVEEQQRLERKYLQQLRNVQEHHVRLSLGIYSTAAASNSPLMKHIEPVAMIMDEASQSLEATAVSAILHGIECGSLVRIILIGDDLQLPPTVMANNNPFRATAAMSLFERLIKSGAPVQTLTEQYRMQSTISSIVTQEIYRPRGINLTDGSRTKVKLDQDTLFRAFLKDFSTIMGKQSVKTDTNAIVISPVKPTSGMSWTAQKLAGSTSKFNLTTAKIMIRTVAQLITFGYKGTDILLISFYSDQVQLLQAVFDGETNKAADGIRITTVDGSQGQERNVVIIDCVVLGAANSDGMGFLSSEKRRFNVAMSRAQHGRIVIAHKNMVKNAKDSTIWNPFMRAAQGSILDGAAFNEGLPNSAFDKRMNDIFHGFQNKTKAQDPPHDQARPARTPRADHDVKTFEAVTGSTHAIAEEFLKKYKELHLAIEQYYRTHEDDGMGVEEINAGMGQVSIRK